MTKQYCFLRHAEPTFEEGPLTERGRKSAQNLTLQTFDAAVSSPATRAFETACLIYGKEDILIIPELYLFDMKPAVASKVCAQIAELPGQSILVVAHGGIINQVAATLFPQFAPEILRKRLGYAEGFLITEDALIAISS
jgi:broad specificity phosphatase PhoE